MKKLSLLFLLAVACATQGPSVKVQQSNYRLPGEGAIEEDAERGKFHDAMTHQQRGDIARESGNMDQARAEWREGAKLLTELAEQFPNSNFRLVYRSYASRFFLTGGDPEAAARCALAMAQDKDAQPSTQAFGYRLAAEGFRHLVNADVKAGRAEAINILPASARKGQEPRPRPLAESWRRFVDAADRYVALYKADVETGAEDAAAGFAMQAAQAHFTYDNVEEAARRYAAFIDTFPRSEYWGDAIQQYLQTFFVRKDQAGHAAALEQMAARVAAEAKKAAEAAARPRAPDRDKQRAEALARLEGVLQAARHGVGFDEGQALLTAGKFAEAGASLQKWAEANPTNPNAAVALYNAGVGYERAKDHARARAVREQILARYPDTRLAPKAAVAIAAGLSAAGDHAGSAQRYTQYLEKWPQGEDRCLALQNVGAELDQAKQEAEAARRFVAFGTDPSCAKEDPNAAARQLYRAAALYNRARRDSDAKGALRALAALQGVNGAVEKTLVDDAKSRLKK